MSFWIAGAAVTAGVITAGASIYNANAQSQAAQNAADTQSEAAQAGIGEQRRQFDAVQQLLAPYVQAGTGSLKAQQDLAGLNGPGAQQAAIDAIQNGPQFTSLIKQGENSILQNAAATGGVRGGNVQGALGSFRPQILNQLIGDQYQRLAGITGLGQASAAGQAAAGQANANQISNLLTQQGQAQAGGALAQGTQNTQIANALAGLGGTLISQGGKIGDYFSNLPKANSQ